MIFLYIVVFIGSLIASLGIPSRSGRIGSSGNSLMVIGFVISIVGVILLFVNGGIVTGIVSLITALLLPSIISQFRK